MRNKAILSDYNRAIAKRKLRTTEETERDLALSGGVQQDPSLTLDKSLLGLFGAGECPFLSTFVVLSQEREDSGLYKSGMPPVSSSLDCPPLTSHEYGKGHKVLWIDPGAKR